MILASAALLTLQRINTIPVNGNLKGFSTSPRPFSALLRIFRQFHSTAAAKREYQISRPGISTWRHTNIIHFRFLKQDKDRKTKSFDLNTPSHSFGEKALFTNLLKFPVHHIWNCHWQWLSAFPYLQRQKLSVDGKFPRRIKKTKVPARRII